MRLPINGEITITGKFKEVAQPGTGLSDGKVRRHIGVDLRAKLIDALAVGSGTVTDAYTSASGLKVVEIRASNYLWRYLHLAAISVKKGDAVSEGQKLGTTGNSGGVPYHLHIDCRKDGTGWKDSLNNYLDPITVIEELNRAYQTPATGGKFKVGDTIWMKPPAIPGWRIRDEKNFNKILGKLMPNKFNHGPNNLPGLTYRVLAVYGNYVAIKTDSFGRGVVYAGDSDAVKV